MNSFAHHVIRRADVEIAVDGKTLRITIDATPMDRMVIEIKDGTLAIHSVRARSTGSPSSGP